MKSGIAPIVCSIKDLLNHLDDETEILIGLRYKGRVVAECLDINDINESYDWDIDFNTGESQIAESSRRLRIYFNLTDSDIEEIKNL